MVNSGPTIEALGSTLCYNQISLMLFKDMPERGKNVNTCGKIEGFSFLAVQQPIINYQENGEREES